VCVTTPKSAMAHYAFFSYLSRMMNRTTVWNTMLTDSGTPTKAQVLKTKLDTVMNCKKGYDRSIQFKKD